MQSTAQSVVEEPDQWSVRPPQDIKDLVAKALKGRPGVPRATLIWEILRSAERAGLVDFGRQMPPGPPEEPER